GVPTGAPAGRNESAMRSLNGDSFRCTKVIGEGADHCTRGRVRSPTQLNNHALEPVLKFRGSPVFAEKAGWRGATREDTPAVSDRGATKPAGLFRENPPGGGPFVR